MKENGWTLERIMEENLYEAVPIVQRDSHGRLVKEWPSASSAARTLGYRYDKILACTNGRKETYQGFYWEKKEKGKSSSSVKGLF